MYIYVNIYICIYIYVYICIYMYVYVYIFMYMYIYVNICIYIYMYLYIYIYVFVCIYIYICICTYIYICICMYLYMYIYVFKYIYFVYICIYALFLFYILLHAGHKPGVFAHASWRKTPHKQKPDRFVGKRGFSDEEHGAGTRCSHSATLKISQSTPLQHPNLKLPDWLRRKKLPIRTPFCLYTWQRWER